MSAGSVRRVIVALATLGGGAAFGSPAHAQTGSGSIQCDLGPRLPCVGMESRDRQGRGEDAVELEWTRVVVIWRADADVSGMRMARGEMPDTAALRMASAAERASRFASEEKGHLHLGQSVGTRWWRASLSGWNMMGPRRQRAADTLFVLDQWFRVPMRDTAVIVLVDGVHGAHAGPRIVGALTVPSPSRVKTPDRRWTSGDTTFWVRSKAEGPTAEEFLRSIPEVLAFLERNP